MSNDTHETAQAALRRAWIAFLAGPVIWFLHFMVVYVAAEVACEFDVLASQVLGLPAVSVVIVAATIVAAIAILVFAGQAYRLVRDRGTAGEADRHQALEFAGLLLGLFFFVAVLFVGVPALFLKPC